MYEDERPTTKKLLKLKEAPPSSQAENQSFRFLQQRLGWCRSQKDVKICHGVQCYICQQDWDHVHSSRWTGLPTCSTYLWSGSGTAMDICFLFLYNYVLNLTDHQKFLWIQPWIGLLMYAHLILDVILAGGAHNVYRQTMQNKLVTLVLPEYSELNTWPLFYTLVTCWWIPIVILHWLFSMLLQNNCRLALMSLVFFINYRLHLNANISLGYERYQEESTRKSP